MSAMKKDLERVLLSKRQISSKIKKLGKEISKDYKDKNLLMVGVLKGSCVTMTDLMRAVNIPCAIDFMCVSSYGSGVESSGTVNIIKDLTVDISNYDVLIVEDILDSGNTLSKLMKVLKERNPKSIKICTLLDKPERRTADIKADYNGFVIADEFVVGYGLDYDEKYRNLPYIGVLKKSVYSK